MKRLFDVIASFTGLVLLIPLFLLVGVLIKLRMPGPVFYCQLRAGRHAKPFTIIKFRTMIPDHGGGTISVKGENRITKLGANLRKYKIDELPELWNILIGEMSFVGPRPDMPEYAARLKGEERLILKLRPGITGPASLKYANEEETLSSVPDPIKYNNEIIWPDKVKLNLDYYYTRSLIKDINIIFSTIFRKS